MERLRAFAIAMFALRLALHHLGLEQTGSPLTFTLMSCVILLLANGASTLFRWHGGAGSSARAASTLTALDILLAAYVLLTLPPLFGVGDFMVFSPVIALAAMRGRLRGALLTWGVVALLTVVGVAAGRGGSAAGLDQVFMVQVVNLTIALLVGRLAEDLHIRFDELDTLARTDSLTGLANRRAFLHLLDHLGDGRRRRVALLFLDLDQFKAVNDTLGHDAGDRVLEIVARRMTHQLRTGDVAARLAGDEFVALIDDIDEHAEADLVERIHHALQEPVDVRGVEVVTTVSVGLASGWSDAVEPMALLSRADAAMYGAKARRSGAVGSVRFHATARDDVARCAAGDHDGGGAISSAGHDGRGGH